MSAGGGKPARSKKKIYFRLKTNVKKVFDIKIKLNFKIKPLKSFCFGMN